MSQPPHLSKGQRAEDRALALLEAEGWRLVTKNFRSRRGEIDLIVQKNDQLAFVEVRFRTTTKFCDAVESVDTAKQARLIATAEHFLHNHPEYDHASCRFDVIAITGHGTGPTVNWIPDAFD